MRCYNVLGSSEFSVTKAQCRAANSSCCQYWFQLSYICRLMQARAIPKEKPNTFGTWAHKGNTGGYASEIWTIHFKTQRKLELLHSQKLTEEFKLKQWKCIWQAEREKMISIVESGGKETHKRSQKSNKWRLNYYKIDWLNQIPQSRLCHIKLARGDILYIYQECGKTPSHLWTERISIKTDYICQKKVT